MGYSFNFGGAASSVGGMFRPNAHGPGILGASGLPTAAQASTPLAWQTAGAPASSDQEFPGYENPYASMSGWGAALGSEMDAKLRAKYEEDYAAWQAARYGKVDESDPHVRSRASEWYAPMANEIGLGEADASTADAAAQGRRGMGRSGYAGGAQATIQGQAALQRANARRAALLDAISFGQNQIRNETAIHQTGMPLLITELNNDSRERIAAEEAAAAERSQWMKLATTGAGYAIGGPLGGYLGSRAGEQLAGGGSRSGGPYIGGAPGYGYGAGYAPGW